MALPRQPLVWIDCEMTGLDPTTDTILEIQCLITDGPSLALVNDSSHTGFHAVIHHTEAQLSKMDNWCTHTHSNSGLITACLSSTTTPDQAAKELLDYVKKWVPKRKTGLLAGNSVHADRAFLSRPPYNALLSHLHHRILDVSSLKEAALRWCPGSAEIMAGAPRKRSLHKAYEDIVESVEEARYYKRFIFERAVGEGEGKRDKAESAT